MEPTKCCEICGGRLNSGNQIGICSKNEKCAKAYRRKHYEENKENVLVVNRLWYENNKEKDLIKGNAWRKANKEHVAKVRRERYASLSEDERRNENLKKKYKIGLVEYNEVLSSQGNCCAICGAANSGQKNSAHLFVDHDHLTGRVRGLLCNMCNTMLSEHFEKFAEAGVEYLTGLTLSKDLPLPSFVFNLRDAKRDIKLRQRYGVGYLWYLATLEHQLGLCAICKTPDPGGIGETFHVDHNHETGEVRGLLCYRCNTMVNGHFEKFVKSAVIYLEQSKLP